MRSSSIISIIAILGALTLPATAPANTYLIGNSLTYDLVNGKLTEMCASRGIDQTVGYHVRSSAFLAYTASNPDDTSVTPPAPYGNYANALPNYQWDAVTFQPYKGWPNGSTLASDVEAISYFTSLTHTNLANSATRFYMYAAWPDITLNGGNPLEYQTQWLRSTTGTSSEPTILARQYFIDLYEALSNSGLDVKMIPAGEVLYTLDTKMRAGEIPGLAGVSDLYRDNFHMNDLGKHVAACTAYATLFADSPVGMAYSGTSTPVDSGALRAIQETVWEVVSTSPYTSVPEPAGATLSLSVFSVLISQRRRHV